MKCNVCPFSLLCLMNHLTSNFDFDHTSIYLCRLCGKLIVRPTRHFNDKIRYTFYCEKRKITHETKKQWKGGYHEYVPFSLGEVYLLRCNICQGIQGQVLYIDLDEHGTTL